MSYFEDNFRMKMKKKRAKILIVDDEKIIQEVMTCVLRKKGFITGIAENGKQALEKITQDKPDIIILDIVMPQMGGLEVYKRLRENPETRHIPIIFLSAEESIKHAIVTQEKTITEYIEKPCDIEYLVKRIKSLTTVKKHPT